MFYYPFFSSNQWQSHQSHFNHVPISAPYRWYPNSYPKAHVSHGWIKNPEYNVPFYNLNPGNSHHLYPIMNHPYRQPKTVQVFLEGIFCKSTGVYEGYDLEIYGSLMANDNLIWHRTEMNPVNIKEGNLFGILEYRNIVLDPNEPLKLQGHLWDQDSPPIDPNDDMKYREIMIPFNEITSEPRRYTLRFKELDQIIEVYFEVKSIDSRISSFHNSQSTYYIPHHHFNNPYRQNPVRAEVLLVGIHNNRSGDFEGSGLAIYGWLKAKDTLLWSVDASNAVTIREGNLYPIRVQKTIRLDPGEPLKLEGHLWERDPFPLEDDDDMEKRELSLSVDELSSNWRDIYFPFSQSDQQVTVFLRVRLV